DGVEFASPPRTYDDVTVFEQLEPLRDSFLARSLDQQRFTRTQEAEWTARIAKDVQKNEHATDAAIRWLKAISLSTKREYCNFNLPLTDEAFQLFVQFFWFIKTAEQSTANELLADRRRQWGLESCFHIENFNQVLESGDATDFYAAWTPYRRGRSRQTIDFAITKAKSRKTLNAAERKRNIRPSSSKRRLTAPPSSKKRRLIAKARLAPRATNSATGQNEKDTVDEDVDTVGLGVVASGSGEIRRSRKRKLGNDDTKYPEPPERTEILKKLRPRADKRSKAKTTRNTRKLGGRLQRPSKPTRERTSGVRDGLKPFQHSTAKPNELNVAAGSSLVSEPGVSLCLDPNPTCSVEPAPKRRSATTTKSARKRRPTVPIIEVGTTTDLDHGMDHTTAKVHGSHVDGRQSPPASTFDKDGAKVLEDADGCTSSEYPILSSIRLEKERHVGLLPRPPLPLTPPIWAQSRQEVCESLDYFRSYQGGVYHSNDTVKGYLLGAHSSSRDLFHHGGKLIISHGSALENRRLEVHEPADQLEDDRSVRALLNNYRSGRPLVVLADDNYALFPFDLTANGYTYVVLGLYWIAHAWAELQRVDENRSVVRYKFAFQWCEGQGDPWWSLGTEEAPVAQAPNSQLCESEPGVMTISLEERENLTSSKLQPHMTNYICPHCRSSSPLVYQDTPICLQPSCQANLDFTSCAQTLSYSTELLRLQPAKHQPVSAESLRPPLLSNGTTTSRPFAKGMHCRDCGRLSTRYKWEDYECSHCHRIYEAPRFVFSHKDFWLQEQTLKFHQHRVAEDSGIVIRKMEFRPRANGSALPYVQTFDLPDNRGCVHLIPGHPSINGKANALFQDYQRQAARGEIQFRRWPLRAVSLLASVVHTYVGGAERTTPLEDGAEAVLGALALIKNRIATALEKEVPFNEVLSAAYMEKQKMAVSGVIYKPLQ
ncbi:hypothetical protein BJV77DRAFT_996606, partial [Russula vinacea]